MKVILLCFYVCVLINSSMSQSCDTQSPNSQKGECVTFRECPELMIYVKKNNLTAADRYFLLARQCSYKDGQYLVCCVEPKRNTAINESGTNKSTSKYLPTAPTCGIDLYDALVSENNTQICESPWMALIQYTYPDGGKGLHCAGVLISDQYVITASHCVNGISITAAGYKLTGVRLGDWQLSTERDCDQSKYVERCSEPYREYSVEETYPHEDYDPNSDNQHNDIALLRLSEKIDKFTLFITPICLPLEDSLRYNDLTQQRMIVTGWGSASKLARSDIKQKVYVKGVGLEKCQVTYTNQSRLLTSSQICAGGEVWQDSCIGDSGGPLILQSLSSHYPYWYLAGIVSYGPNPCGTKDWPGVYTRVDHFIDWIASKIKP